MTKVSKCLRIRTFLRCRQHQPFPFLFLLLLLSSLKCSWRLPVQRRVCVGCQIAWAAGVRNECGLWRMWKPREECGLCYMSPFVNGKPGLSPGKGAGHQACNSLPSFCKGHSWHPTLLFPPCTVPMHTSGSQEQDFAETRGLGTSGAVLICYTMAAGSGCEMRTSLSISVR